MSRHFYTNLDEADRVISLGNAVVAAIETHRAATGAYPQTLPAVQLGAGQSWTYTQTLSGQSFELCTTLNHWVSSFDALVYTPGGSYSGEWLALRH